MSSVVVSVLSTINAPYGTALTAEQLATRIVDPVSADYFDASAFSFFSEVDEDLQYAFLNEMDIDPSNASEVATRFSSLAGYDLPLSKAA